MRQIRAKYGDQFNPEEALRINAELEQAAAETGRTTRPARQAPASAADFTKPGALPPGEDYVPGLRTPYLYQGAESYLRGLENQAAKLRQRGGKGLYDLRGVEHEIGIVRDYLGLPPVEAPEAALAQAAPEAYQQGALDLNATTPTNKPPPEGQLPGENAAPPATPPQTPPNAQRTFGQVYQEWRTSPPGAKKDALLEEFVSNRQSLIDRGGKVPIPPDMRNALAAKAKARLDVADSPWKALADAALGRQAGILPGAARVPTPAITGLAGGIVGAAAAEQQTGGRAAPGDILKGAATGAAIGALGAKAPYADLAGQIAVGHGEGKRLMGEALQNGRFTRSNLFRDWKENIVNTVPGGRQMFLDKIEGMVKAVASDIPPSEVAKTRKDLIARSRAQGGVAEMDRATEQFLTDLGVNPANFDWKQVIGQGFFGGHLTGEQMLHPAQSAATGAATSLATGAAFGVPLLGAALGAARGAIRPYTTGAAHAISDIDQHAFRNTAFRKSAGGMIADAADAFLAQLKRAGVNTAALDGRAGRFSPAEVAQVVGGQQGMQAAAVWHGIVAQVVGAPALQKGQQQVDGLATKFVKDTFGDFSSDPGRAQTWLGRVAPFSRYVMSQMPVVARMVRDHPGAALLVGNLLARQYGNLKDNGEPAYLVGSVPLPDNPVAQAALGGQPGQTRLPLLQVVSPFSGNSASAIDQLGQTDLSSAQGVYQAVTGVLGLLGLSPNPLIDTAAYLMGGNPQAPGPQSRTSGLEQALPGPVVPTVKGLLDNATKALGNQPDAYDPIQMAAREIYFREHGVPISQAPKADQKQLLDPNSPLMQEARGAVTSGGATKNAISILSPATLSTETAVKQQYRQAKAGTQLPYTPAQIQAATKVAPDVAVQMQRANDAAQAQAPATQVYKNPKLTARDKQDPRLTAWERQHAALAHTAPNVYKQLRSEFIRVAGIKTNN